jgi:hypothetical protein
MRSAPPRLATICETSDWGSPRSPKWRALTGQTITQAGSRSSFVVDAVDAQRAFLHHPGILVEFAGPIGASPRAQLAADADLLVDQHDPVLGTLVRGTGRAHGDAGRFLAMQARFREINGSRALPVAFLERVDAVEPHPPGIRSIRVEIGQRSRETARIPLLAGGRTSVAPDTDVEVDDEPELFLACLRLRQRGHRDPSLVRGRVREIPGSAGKFPRKIKFGCDYRQ